MIFINPDINTSVPRILSMKSSSKRHGPVRSKSTSQNLTYKGVILHAHPVRGGSHIQRNATDSAKTQYNFVW